MESQPSSSANGVGICESTRPASTRAALHLAESKRACAEQMGGFERAYRVTFWFSLLALALAALLPGWPFGWGGRAELQAQPTS